MSPAERAPTAIHLGYPGDAVGRYMSTRIVALREHLTVAGALEHVRAHGADSETVCVLPVVDDKRCLVGVVGLRELVLAAADVPVTKLVDTAWPHVRANDPAERAARLMHDAEVIGLPVVDAEDRLVGLLTFDDADKVLEHAECEDARQGGAGRWAGQYMSVSVLRQAWARAVWLALLLAVSLLTVTVSFKFKDALEEVAALALFIPLIIGTGGKVGTQAASACVRALALGEVQLSDVVRVAAREAGTGLLLGAGLGALAAGAGLVFANAGVAVVVALSLLLICLLAALVGGLSPLVAKRAGIDPALVSAPVVTTVVDVLGLLIYLKVASTLLRL